MRDTALPSGVVDMVLYKDKGERIKDKIGNNRFNIGMQYTKYLVVCQVNVLIVMQVIERIGNTKKNLKRET
jgi:hypothetical protein